MDKKELKKIAIVSSAITLIAIIVVGGGGYFLYTRYVSLWWSDLQVNRQAKTIIGQVSKVVFLPEDETPEVATILNVEQLKKGDTFFADAKDGDAALFYKTSGMILLFDMTSKKLLNMGIIATSSASATERVPSNSFNFTH